jgi:hypothetical protein
VSATADDLAEASLAGDPGRVRDLLRGLDEPARRALRPQLKTLTTELRRTGRLWTHPRSYDALGLAVLGCSAGAAAATTHLHRWWKWGPTRGLPVADVLVDRDPPWLPDLFDRLSATDPSDDVWNGHWRVLEELRVRLGVARPRTPSYVRGLVDELNRDYRTTTDPEQPTLLAQISADDELVGLVPLVLEHADGPGLAATTISVYDAQTRRREVLDRPVDDTWPGVVRTLCASGRLDRGAAIDACLRILLRTDAKAASPPHLAILTTLEATPEEVAERRSYVQVAGEANGPCAKHAQRALRTAWEAGALGTETVLETSRLVLARPDKGIVTTQLAWLDKTAKAAGDAPDDTLMVVADAFGHERTDVQERALAVVAKHVGRASPQTVAELVVAATALVPSLRGRAAQVLGASPDAADDDAAPSAVTAGTTGPTGPTGSTGSWPEPPGSVALLAETCAALVEQLDDPVLLESVLAGFARLRNSDRAAFDAAMAPIRHRLMPRASNPESFSAMNVELFVSSPQSKLLRIVLLEPAPPPERRRFRGLFARSRHVHAHALPNPPASPTGVAVQRMRELAAQVLAGESTDLVAVPTEAGGLIDPAVLVARLDALESAGREPWPADLQQAFLRLPRTVDPAALTAAQQLRSPSGQALAARLRAGHPDPLSRPVVAQVVPRNRWMWPAHPQGEVALVALDGPFPDPRDIATLALTLPDPHERAGRLTRDLVARDMALWPTTMPGHPEVVAAHAMLALCDLPIAGGTAPGRHLVAGLPALDGPHGPAVALAVANSLAAQDAADRTAGVDAVVGLAARQVSGAAYGQAVLLLGRGDHLKLGRVATALGDALRAGPGAATFVWQLAEAALPALLAQDTRDTHRLIAVAADAAAVSRARGALDGLARVAQRGGTSRLVTEARRLQDILAP